MALEYLDLNNKSQVEEYERFVKSCDKGHFAQSVMWAKIKTDWKFEAVIVRGENGEITGSMGVLVRRVPLFRANMMYSPRGPVCDIHDMSVMRALMDGVNALAKKYGAYILKIDPDVKSSDGEFVKICRELNFTLPTSLKISRAFSRDMFSGFILTAETTRSFWRPFIRKPGIISALRLKRALR